MARFAHFGVHFFVPRRIRDGHANVMGPQIPYSTVIQKTSTVA